MMARQRLNVGSQKHWSTDTYAVRERFGLGLIMLATVYVAGFFAGLRLLGAADGVALFLSLLLVWVAFIQAWCRKWGRPRTASYAAGAAYFLVWALWMSVVDVDGVQVRVVQVFLLGLPLVAVGAACGYLAGAIVASLFLVYDYLAIAFGSKQREREALERALGRSPRESPWDE